MIHLGTRDFYREVHDRLSSCQVIVAEGVAGGSVAVRALTMAYRTPARSRRLGLVVQPADLRGLSASGAEVIRPDITGKQFRRAWRTVPWLQRAVIIGLVPVFAMAFRLFGDRRMLARYLATDDLPTAQEQQLHLTFPALTKLLLADRDRLLVRAIETILAARAAESINVGVLYGADHLPAVVRALAERGYRPRKAEWVTVFDF
jgi:hypothetical protein